MYRDVDDSDLDSDGDRYAPAAHVALGLQMRLTTSAKTIIASRLEFLVSVGIPTVILAAVIGRGICDRMFDAAEFFAGCGSIHKAITAAGYHCIALDKDTRLRFLCCLRGGEGERGSEGGE